MSVNTLDVVPFRRSPPGVSGYSPALVGALLLRWQQLQAQHGGSEDWARHRLEDGTPRFLNRLLLCDEALYREHAHDPVDWHPFGPDAFAEARRRACPVLLWVARRPPTVGDGRWDRVFGDIHVAHGINRSYVSVLLCGSAHADEVERYLSAAELLGGERGESAVLWLTPGRAPYAAWSGGGDRLQASEAVGTLLSLLETQAELPEQAVIERCATGKRPGCSGMSSVFVSVDRERLEGILSDAGARLAEHWRMYLGQPGSRGAIPPGLLRFAMRHGGRAERPELLRWAQDRLEEALRGAGRDHLGGGYYADWQGPGRLPRSFDKELAGNAELSSCFIEAWELSGRREMFWASEEILHLAWGELRSEFGAFHTALRRPAEGGAGGRELGWAREELEAVLGEGLFEVVQPALGLWDLGHGRALVTLPPFTDSTEQHGVRRTHVERARALLAERSGRLNSHQVDQRVLPGANGLAVAAMARTARNLDHIGPDARTWLDTAVRAAESTTQLLWHRGRLHEASLHGQREPGQADLLAHVQLALGFLELFESTGEVSWLRMCLALEDALESLWSGQPVDQGSMNAVGLRDRLAERERAEEAAAWSLLLARLATLLSDPQRRSRAMALLRPWFSRLEEDPMGYASLLASAERVLAEPQVLLVWSHEDSARRAAFLGVLRGVGASGREVVVTSEGCDLDELPLRLPIAAHHRGKGEQAAAYVCGSRACSRGLETPYALQRFLLGSESPWMGPQVA